RRDSVAPGMARGVLFGGAMNVRGPIDVAIDALFDYRPWAHGETGAVLDGAAAALAVFGALASTPFDVRAAALQPPRLVDGDGGEVDRVAGKPRAETPEVGGADHRDDGVAAGRGVVGPKDDELARRRRLDGAAHHRRRRSAPGRRRDPRAREPDAHPVADRADGVAGAEHRPR